MEISLLSRILLDLLLKGKSVALEGIGLFSFKRQLAVVGSHDEFEDPNEYSVNFNPSIIFRDSNLIASVAEVLQVPESQAELSIGKSLRTIRAKMSKGEKVLLNGIGELTQDRDGSYIFCSNTDVMASSNFDFFNSDNDELQIIHLESSANKGNTTKKIVFGNWWIFAILGVIVLSLGALLAFYWINISKEDSKFVPTIPEKTNIKPIQEIEVVPEKTIQEIQIVPTKPPAIRQDLIESRKAIINMGEFILEEDAQKLVKLLRSVKYEASLIYGENWIKVVVLIEYQDESTLNAALLSLRRNFVSQAFIENFNYSNN
ncbi:MAG: hypothetical protein RJA52_601 [Bacteroidota bacterium]